jgi:hypothetical protein
VIAGDVAALAEHAVTRHHERDRILADRGADRARRLGRAELDGDVRIGGRPAHRDSEQRLPHPHLEVGADQHHPQRPVGAPQLGVEDAACQHRGPRLVVDIAGLGPAAAHVGERRFLLAGVREGEAGEPTLGRHHQRGAERGGMKAVADGEAVAAGLPLARRHRLVRHEQIVQPARTRQPDLERGVEHARRVAQQPARMVERDRLQEGLGSEPRPAAEQMMQLGGGDAGGRGDRLGLRLVAPVLGDERDGAAHHVIVGGRDGERREIGNTVGREHGCLHSFAPYLGRGSRVAHPISAWKE